MSSATDTTAPLQRSQSYWNAAAERYGEVFTETRIGRMWREAVQRDLDAAFPPSTVVLELNCGTGADAIHLASRGVAVLACDISSRMIDIARQNATEAGVSEQIDFRVLATEQLATLDTDMCFDGAFSNFSGLNCVQDLAAVRTSLAARLKPGSRVLLCMLGRYGIWQRLWHLARGEWSRALQIPRTREVGNAVVVQYPSRRSIVDVFSVDFKFRRWKGIGIAVPPPFLEQWFTHFPRVMQCLDEVDKRIEDVPILRHFGACILLEFEKA
ncbi:MAG: hypothetical protein QOH85_603 [Acidobacteriaceae bacterium]|nr:hypothetical protein [Acidobacteriaceae bacterium]